MTTTGITALTSKLKKIPGPILRIIRLNSSNFDYDRVEGSNGEDIRFTLANETICDYWIETWSTSGNSTIWLEVPSLSASSTTTVYMYYGNPSAASGEDGSATFVDFAESVTTKSFSTDMQNSNGYIIETNVTATALSTEGPQINFDITGSGCELTAVDFYKTSNQLRRN